MLQLCSQSSQLQVLQHGFISRLRSLKQTLLFLNLLLTSACNEKTVAAYADGSTLLITHSDHWSLGNVFNATTATE